MKEKLKKVPLVEIAGQNRVLVENHMGVLAYSLEQILIKVAFGTITVTGSQLRLMQLCNEQLVITGTIQAITLEREEC